MNMKISQLCRGESDRPDRGCREKAPHRPEQERSGGAGHEALYERRDPRAGRPFKRAAGSALKVDERESRDVYAGIYTSAESTAVTLAHHMGAYFEMFKRDRSRMKDIYKRMNLCPLGSGALAGTTYPLAGNTRQSSWALTDRHSTVWIQFRTGIT